MAIDTSMYNGLLQRPKSVAEYDAEAMQNQQAMQQNRLAGLKMDEYNRGVQRQNKLLQLVSTLPAEATDDQRINMMKASGYFDEADKLEKGMLERQKTGAEVGFKKAETDAKGADTAIKRGEVIGQTLGALMRVPGVNAQHISNAVQHLIDIQALPPELGQKIIAGVPQDPSQIMTFLQTGRDKVMSAKEQRAYTDVDANTNANNQTSIATNAATNATSRANNASTVGATIRGQNLVDSRSRETNALSREAQATIYDPDRGILVNKATGVARPAATMDGSPVAPKDKPLTEFQGKSAAFGDRAMKADKILSDLTGNYSPTAVNVKQGLGSVWGVGGALEAGANMALGANSQKAEQAQRDFINALLRQESGAAIGVSEFDNAKKQYFPQPGDSKEVVAQKAANRKTAIDGFIRSAGPSAKLRSSSAPAAPSANIDALLKKYGQ